MAIKMNLLPPEYTTTKGMALVMKTIRSLGVISVVLFFVFTIGLSGFYLISSASLRSINTQIETLKSQITSNQKVEQQVVLTKDRISKIKTIKSQANIDKNLVIVSPYISGTQAGTTLNDLSVDTTKIEFTQAFSSSTELSSFLSKISSDKNFKTVTMTSFTYNPASGYAIEISAVPK